MGRKDFDARNVGLTMVNVIVLAFATGLVWLVSLVVGVVANGIGGVAVPIAPIVVLLAFAAKPYLDGIARRFSTTRGASVTGFSLVGLAPLAVFGALYAMGDPLADTHHFRCGTGLMALYILAPFVIVGAGMASGVLGLVFMSANKHVDAVLRAATWTAILGATAITSAATFRASLYPDVDHWADAFPIVAEVGRVAGTPTEVIRDGDAASAPHRIYDAETADLVVRRSCVLTSCELWLERKDAASSGARHDEVDPKRDGVEIKDDASAVIRRDRKGDRYIVTASTWTPQSSAGRAVFRGSDLEIIDVRVADVASTTSAPRGWIAGAAAGLIIAFVLQSKRRRDARAMAELVGARSGTLTNGSIALDDDGSSLRAPPGFAETSGRVAVVSTRRSEAYRDAEAVAVRVIAGDRDELLAALRGKLAGYDATSLGLVVATVAPLLAAYANGLVV